MLYFTPKKFQVHEVCGSNSIGKRRCQAGGSPSALCRKSCVEVWFNFSPFLHSLPLFSLPSRALHSVGFPMSAVVPPSPHRDSPLALSLACVSFFQDSASKQRRVEMTKMQNFFRFPPSFKITLNESMQPHFIIDSGLKQVIIE